jgi:hypothetical protein
MQARFICLVLASTVAYAQQTKPALHFGVKDDSFYTSGRWVPSDPKDKAAHPSEVEIDCNGQQKICIEATAEYYSGHPHVSIDYLDITKWDTNGIIATSSSGICMTRTVLISFATMSISDTHSLKVLDKNVKGACAYFGASDTEIDIFVVKGSDKWEANPYGEK